MKLHLDDSTQFATVWSDDDRPLATLRRRHAFDPRDDPRWKMFNLHGEVIRKWFLPTSYERLIRDVERQLDRMARDGQA